MFERTRSLLHRLTRASRAHAEIVGDERRTWERYPADREATVRLGLNDDDDIVVGRIQDISRGGIRLLLERSVEAGTMVRIELASEGAASQTVVLACVVHMKEGRDGRFSAGCNFSTELSDADLATLGVRRERSGADQRAFPRLPVAGKAIYSLVSEPGEMNSAEIHNISLTGVALIVGVELSAGALLNVVLMDSAGHKVMTIVACVVYLSALRESQWLAGCNFVRELYDEDVSALIAVQ